jgi:anti-sigma regulatory factor (Ser/Thr protein kinase)
VAINLTAAFPVREASGVAEARRAATTLAQRLHFPDARAGQVALIASELATNLTKHAKEGEILVRPLTTGRGEPPSGVEIVSIDKGPGIPDVTLSALDGYSTGGTLGHGLGAIDRQSDFSEIYSRPSGTVIVSQTWREPLKGGPDTGGIELGAVNVSKTGEDFCGDGWDWRLWNDRLSVIVADGLGHGLHAHEAARLAIETFGKHPSDGPARIVEDVHAALRSTRGAAVAVLHVDLERSTVHYSGLGNITSRIAAGRGTYKNLVSHNGTAGHAASRIQEFHDALSERSVVIMYTDGVSGHWDLAAYPSLQSRHASIIAGVIYRDFSRRRDDVTVVVFKAGKPG